MADGCDGCGGGGGEFYSPSTHNRSYSTGNTFGEVTITLV